MWGRGKSFFSGCPLQPMRGTNINPGSFLVPDSVPRGSLQLQDSFSFPGLPLLNTKRNIGVRRLPIRAGNAIIRPSSSGMTGAEAS